MRIRILALLFVLLPLSSFGQPYDQVEVSFTGGKSMTNWHGQADIQILGVGFVRSLSPRTDFTFAVAPVNLWQPRSWFGDQYGDGNENVQALSTAVMMRRTFNRDSPRVHYYLELGSGPMLAKKRVPAATSHFNFMSQGGAGFVFRPNASYPILLGFKFLHISNGGYAPRNPGLNIASLTVGTRFRMPPRRR
ncbi:MAG TPA: acyloxyacyl hydrolase [Thermoanaerobaculia bacterium]|nr:acyloxyacyl hydrolase [Thermoanaerobaculia bacterium]